jgi:tetratricopeptide (TPR) repeat protein
MSVDRLAQLMKLHQADPADPFCTYGIALEHAKGSRYDEALTWLDRTLTIDPGYCYAYFQKAKALSAKGDEPGARQVLETGIATATRIGTAESLHAAEEMRGLMASL